MGANWNTGAAGWPSPYVKVLMWQRLNRSCAGRLRDFRIPRPSGHSTYIYMSTMLYMALLEKGGWTRWIPEVPLKISPSVLLWFCETELYCYGQRLPGEELSCLLQRLIILPSDDDTDKVALLIGYTEAVPEAVGSSDLGVQPPKKAYPVQTSVRTSAKRPNKIFYMKVIYLQICDKYLRITDMDSLAFHAKMCVSQIMSIVTNVFLVLLTFI